MVTPIKPAPHRKYIAYTVGKNDNKMFWVQNAYQAARALYPDAQVIDFYCMSEEKQSCFLVTKKDGMKAVVYCAPYKDK